GIYRRFDALNARHILYLQAELCILEKQLRVMEHKDKEKDKEGRLGYAVDYQRMLETQKSQGKEQLVLIRKMHRKLNEYNKALIQISVLHQLQPPDKFDLSDIQHFLESDVIEPGFLQGVDRHTWGTCDDTENHAPDLIGIHPRKKEDDFSHFISENAIHLFKCGLGRLTKGDRNLSKKVYYDSTVLKVTSWITCILASLLPIASILVLVNLQSLKTKLWVIAAFNILTSVCLSVLTDAKRSEAFAVTAAFAAVQVVFVGTDHETPVK
ncbi:uncharacterized protein SETTUDRAFT_108559, partial [Exserohilum turcica Et28A]